MSELPKLEMLDALGKSVINRDGRTAADLADQRKRVEDIEERVTLFWFLIGVAIFMSVLALWR